MDSEMALPDATHARRVLLMVAELHVRGYQRLRIYPYQYALGSWRCCVAPATGFLRTSGAWPIENVDNVGATYSTAQGKAPFDWHDARYTNPSGLARRFIERFSEIAEAGRGEDWLYAGWFTWMLHLTYPDRLPVVVTEWTNDISQGLPTIMADGSELTRDIRVPLPPGESRLEIA